MNAPLLVSELNAARQREDLVAGARLCVESPAARFARRVGALTGGGVRIDLRSKERGSVRGVQVNGVTNSVSELLERGWCPDLLIVTSAEMTPLRP